MAWIRSDRRSWVQPPYPSRNCATATIARLRLAARGGDSYHLQVRSRQPSATSLPIVMAQPESSIFPGGSYDRTGPRGRESVEPICRNRSISIGFTCTTTWLGLAVFHLSGASCVIVLLTVVSWDDMALSHCSERRARYDQRRNGNIEAHDIGLMPMARNISRT